MLSHESFTIPEASILFYSDHYQNLKCKIIQKQTSHTLCSKLISNCLETTCSINRNLEQFIVQLYQTGTLVASFDFNYDDLEEALSMENYQYQIGNKKRKYIKFKKENDCCALYFTIQVKDVLLNQRHTQEEYIYEDYVRQIANKAYKKLEERALKRIQNLEDIKLQNKRLSGPNCKTTEIEKGFQFSHFKKQAKANESAKVIKQEQTKHGHERIPIFTQSCIFSLISQNQNEHQKKKSQYKLKRLREKAKKLFHREISQLQKNQAVIIPQVKMTRRNMGLLSEGIVFPSRLKSQNDNYDDWGIKTNGFIETFQIDNEKQNIKSSKFNTNVFETTGFTFKKARITSTLKLPDPDNLPINIPKMTIKLPSPTIRKLTRKCATFKKSPLTSNFNQTVQINSKMAIKYKEFR